MPKPLTTIPKAKAIDYHTKIKEEIGDKKGIASSLNNIGNIYKDQGDSKVIMPKPSTTIPEA
jgi:hypothetical protein